MRAIKQLIVAGDSPPAVVALAEDGAAFILEAHPIDIPVREAHLLDARNFEYRWRALPGLPEAQP